MFESTREMFVGTRILFAATREVFVGTHILFAATREMFVGTNFLLACNRMIAAIIPSPTAYVGGCAAVFRMSAGRCCPRNGCTHRAFI